LRSPDGWLGISPTQIMLCGYKKFRKAVHLGIIARWNRIFSAKIDFSRHPSCSAAEPARKGGGCPAVAGPFWAFSQACSKSEYLDFRFENSDGLKERKWRGPEEGDFPEKMPSRSGLPSEERFLSVSLGSKYRRNGGIFRSVCGELKLDIWRNYCYYYALKFKI